MTSADFCRINPALTDKIASPALLITHWDRPPQIRTSTFPLRLPHLHIRRLLMEQNRWDGLHHLLLAYPDEHAFYVVRVPQCRVLPPASFPPHLAVTQLPLARP